MEIKNVIEEANRAVDTEVERQTGYGKIVAVIDDDLVLEAVNKNILIKEDAFRTGFECPTCDGEGHIGEPCKKCLGKKVVAQNPDYNVAAATLSEKELELLPPAFKEMLLKKRKEQVQEVVDSGGLLPCKACVIGDKRGGSYISGLEKCPICKGVGASIAVPEEAMRRPTSGVVVSVGQLCTFIQSGDRVVYSNMMGSGINFKGNILFRVMREDEIMIRLHGKKSQDFQKKLSR